MNSKKTALRGELLAVGFWDAFGNNVSCALERMGLNGSTFRLNVTSALGFGGVAELVDAADSKSVGGDTLGVRVPPPLPTEAVHAVQKLSKRATLYSLLALKQT